jgi:endophilin-A
MTSFPFSGLKKQLNKANQYMSEKIMTGVEGTKLNNEFQDMENRTDVFNEMVDDLQLKTKEYLQPNPTVRAKMAAVKGISKLSGQAKASTYPQPEGTLGEAMIGHGRKLEDYEHIRDFAEALIETGETLKQMADMKYVLDDSVKQNFLEPLHHTQSKELKEVMHHRRKLQGRKLDFDCKKRKGSTAEEIRLAEEKFAESLHLSQLGMHNLLDCSGVEHISQLTQFSEALLEYHRNCIELLQPLIEKLHEKRNEASLKPKPIFAPKTLEDFGIERAYGDYNTGGCSRLQSSNHRFDKLVLVLVKSFNFLNLI